MQHRSLRIALTDKKLLESLKALHNEPEFLLCPPESLGELVGEVDAFLLDDDTAIRFLGTRSQDSWPSVIVVAQDGQAVPASFRQGIVDDMLVLPARALDLERMLRTNELVRALRVLEESSRGVGDLVNKLQEDISLAQKIQRRLIREKFPALGPLSVKSKYWCGLKSGGDYFDLFEFPGGTHAGLILSDSSSYSLSTGLIGSLMQFSVHVGRDELENPARIVNALWGKMKESVKEKDKLSLLYGILDRKTYAFKFVACGGIFFAKRGKDGKVTWGAKGSQPALALGQPVVPEASEMSLEPGDRLLLCSDGWGEALGMAVPAFVEEFLGRSDEAQELMNEMAFRLRNKLEKESDDPIGAEDEFPMPPQDCSVMILELAQNVLRLARQPASR